MTESGMRRCGPECGVRECKAQGLVQSMSIVRSTEIGAEVGQRYGIGTGWSESLGFNL